MYVQRAPYLQDFTTKEIPSIKLSLLPILFALWGSQFFCGGLNLGYSFLFTQKSKETERETRNEKETKKRNT